MNWRQLLNTMILKCDSTEKITSTLSLYDKLREEHYCIYGMDITSDDTMFLSVNTSEFGDVPLDNRWLINHLGKMSAEVLQQVASFGFDEDDLYTIVSVNEHGDFEELDGVVDMEECEKDPLLVI